MKIRIATRKSALALWQAEHVADFAAEISNSVDTALSFVPLSTRGDEVLDRSLQKIGGKGLFIKELELAMLGRRCRPGRPFHERRAGRPARRTFALRLYSKER